MEWGYILSDHAIYLDLEGMPCSRGVGFVPFAGCRSWPFSCKIFDEEEEEEPYLFIA